MSGRKPTAISRRSRTSPYVRKRSATLRRNPAGRSKHPYFFSTWLERDPCYRVAQPTRPFRDRYPRAMPLSSSPCSRWLCPMPFPRCRSCRPNLFVRLQATCTPNPMNLSRHLGNRRHSFRTLPLSALVLHPKKRYPLESFSDYLPPASIPDLHSIYGK